MADPKKDNEAKRDAEVKKPDESPKTSQASQSGPAPAPTGTEPGKEAAAEAKIEKGREEQREVASKELGQEREKAEEQHEKDVDKRKGEDEKRQQERDKEVKDAQEPYSGPLRGELDEVARGLSLSQLDSVIQYAATQQLTVTNQQVVPASEGDIRGKPPHAPAPFVDAGSQSYRKVNRETRDEKIEILNDILDKLNEAGIGNVKQYVHSQLVRDNT